MPLDGDMVLLTYLEVSPFMPFLFSSTVAYSSELVSPPYQTAVATASEPLRVSMGKSGRLLVAEDKVAPTEFLLTYYTNITNIIIDVLIYKNLLVLFVGDGLADKFLSTDSGPISGLVIFTIPARPSNSFLLYYKQTK